MSKAKPDIELSNEEIESELDAIDRELDKLIDNAPFYAGRIEALIIKRTKLDDILLEREA